MHLFVYDRGMDKNDVKEVVDILEVGPLSGIRVPAKCAMKPKEKKGGGRERAYQQASMRRLREGGQLSGMGGRSWRSQMASVNSS